MLLQCFWQLLCVLELLPAQLFCLAHLEGVRVALPFKRMSCKQIWVHPPHYCTDELLGIRVHHCRCLFEQMRYDHVPST